MMTIYRDQLMRRIGGTICGLGFLALGLYSLTGLPATLEEAAANRVFWFGVTTLIAGIVALPASWLIKRVDGVWCSPPKRWG